jgi:hypothetical protein
MEALPNPFLEEGSRSTFDPNELLAALESILQEVDLPVFIADPRDEFLKILGDIAA